MIKMKQENNKCHFINSVANLTKTKVKTHHHLLSPQDSTATVPQSKT